jgi:ribonuclease E
VAAEAEAPAVTAEASPDPAADASAAQSDGAEGEAGAPRRGWWQRTFG